MPAVEVSSPSPQNRDERHRTFIEAAMVFATIISAAATVMTAVYSSEQLQASRAQLTASDKNRAFIEALEKFEAVCEPFSFWPEWFVDGEDQVFIQREYADRLFNEHADDIAKALETTFPAFQRSLSRLKVWSDDDEFDLHETMGSELFFRYWLLMPKNLAVHKRTKNGNRNWLQAFINSHRSCGIAEDGLIDWFRKNAPYKGVNVHVVVEPDDLLD